LSPQEVKLYPHQNDDTRFSEDLIQRGSTFQVKGRIVQAVLFAFLLRHISAALIPYYNKVAELTSCM
jgi:hypothetical protein